MELYWPSKFDDQAECKRISCEIKDRLCQERDEARRERDDLLDSILDTKFVTEEDLVGMATHMRSKQIGGGE